MLQAKVKSLSDDDSYDEEENISENGDKEGYLFSSKWTFHISTSYYFSYFMFHKNLLIILLISLFSLFTWFFDINLLSKQFSKKK